MGSSKKSSGQHILKLAKPILVSPFEEFQPTYGSWQLMLWKSFWGSFLEVQQTINTSKITIYHALKFSGLKIVPGCNFFSNKNRG